MKYNFTPISTYVPDWNGNKDLPEAEQIKMKLGVLSMGDLLDLMDTMEKEGHKGEVDSDQMSISATKSIVNTASQILPKYVTEFSGLEVDAGPITVEQLCQYPQFISLIVEITFQLISLSTPNEADTKNLKGLSA